MLSKVKGENVMKYANLYMQRESMNNLGDNMQLLALQNLYNKMDINEEEIVRIHYNELSTYDGDYVILPINYPFYGYRNDLDITMFSDKIIPVFLGLSIIGADVSEEERIYLRRYEPIGCRDQYTCELLRSAGIQAYVNGCMTLTFPKRRNGYDDRKKIYCVDIDERLKNRIPKELLDDCIFTTQIVVGDINAEEMTKDYINTYINDAMLVITSRLHCAVPCLALGIPVILYKEHYSFRFPWLNKLLPVYTKSDIDNIDWNGHLVDCEGMKQLLLDNAIDRIRETYDKYNKMCTISQFYEVSKEENEKCYTEHIDMTINYIKENWKSDQVIKYSVWGITQPANRIIKYIEDNYKNAQLTYVYDKNKQIEFCGVKAKDPKEIEHDSDTFIFVCSASAFHDAEKLMKHMGKNNYFQCSGDGVMK